MENLKRILIVMVSILVVIVTGGGLYLASMGNMDHGTVPVADQSQGQMGFSESADENGNAKNKSTADKDTKTDNAVKNESAPQKDDKSQDSAANGQIVIQVPAPTQSTDPSVYINQLKEKLKSINESNSSIANNSGDHQSTNGQAASGQGNMNQLHQDFYKLGKDITAMEYALDNLSEGLKQGQNNPAQPGTNGFSNNGAAGYYQYQVPNNGTNPYVVIPQQPQPGQPSGTQDPNQGQTGHQPQVNSQVGQGHADTQSGGHTTGLNLLNADTLKLVLSLVLVVSIILGIVSVVGFIGSLFKSERAKGNAVQG